jgi:hypothetical protein
VQLFLREKNGIICDEITMRTGRLCKCVVVLDLNFASLAKVKCPWFAFRPFGSILNNNGAFTLVKG